MKPRTVSLSIIFFLKHVHTPLLTPIHLILWPRRQALSSPHHPHEIIQLELSGIYNASTVRALKAQIKRYRPDLIFLSKTKTTINRVETVRNSIKFNHMFVVKVPFSLAHRPKDPGPNNCSLVDWAWFTTAKGAV